MKVGPRTGFDWPFHEAVQDWPGSRRQGMSLSWVITWFWLALAGSPESQTPSSWVTPISGVGLGAGGTAQTGFQVEVPLSYWKRVTWVRVWRM